MRHRPPGQIDAFVSSDEGSDMDVSENEADEPIITQPFTAVAPSDYNGPSKVPNEGSFVSNMRNYAAQQARDPSNRIVTPRVEHFNNESNPIQVDSDSDNESTCSFHTAPSSPREEENDDDELELEIAKLKQDIEKNNHTVNGIETEIVELQKQKSDVNLEILEIRVRSSISTRKRNAQREIPKSTGGAINQTQASSSKNIAESIHTAITNQNKGKERAYPSQPSPLRQNVPTTASFANLARIKQNVTVFTTPQPVIVQPFPQRQRNNTNSRNLDQNIMGIAKDTINLKRRADEKQIQRNTKKLKNIELKNDMRAEKKKNAMEINRTAIELAVSMATENSQSTSQEASMEEGELLNSSSTSSDEDDDDDGHGHGRGSVSIGDNRNGSSRNSIPIVPTTPNNKSLGIGTKVIKTQNPPMHHTANRNNFQPYKSALSSIGLGPSPVTSNNNSEDKPLCTFEQNGGTCNNDSCQAAHFRDFL